MGSNDEVLTTELEGPPAEEGEEEERVKDEIEDAVGDREENPKGGGGKNDG